MYFDVVPRKDLAMIWFRIVKVYPHGQRGIDEGQPKVDTCGQKAVKMCRKCADILYGWPQNQYMRKFYDLSFMFVFSKL